MKHAGKMSELNPYQTPQTTGHDVDPSPLLVPAELRAVRQGLFTTHYGIVGTLLAIVGGPLLLVIAGIAGFDLVAITIGFLMGLLLLVGVVAAFAGQVRCIGVPLASGAKGMVVGAVICQALSFLGMAGNYVMKTAFWDPTAMSSSSYMGLGVLVDLIASIAGFFGLTLFVFFLRRLNVYIGHERNARACRTLIGMMIVFAIGYFLFLGLRWSLGMGSPMGATVIAQGLISSVFFLLILLLLGLVTFVKYANLVLYTAKAIGKPATAI